MSKPSSEQGLVIDAPDRVRIVRAGPGCGKTWLVAEVIRRTLGTWKSPGGIAALSFTNVGGEEIRRAIGHDLPGPHFVGTLDSFVYRFIVRQFAHILDEKFRRLRLVPIESGDPLKFTDAVTVKLPDAGRDRASLFDVVFTGGLKTDATLAIKEKWGQPTRLSRNDSTIALRAKHKLWATHAISSYSDVTYIAAAILRHETHGKRIRELLSTRFPFLVVDELQDTGWYLSEIVRDLLGEPSSGGLLVGDPDQAIYEFNGARPELFDEFHKIPGSKEYPVRKSLRCPEAITNVANHLLSGTALVEPRAGKMGTAILVATDAPATFLNEVREILGTRSDLHIHNVVCRTNDGVDRVTGGKVSSAPQFGSRPLAQIHLGVKHLLAGAPRKAVEAVMGAILYVLADQTAATEAVLAALHIDEQDLRVAAARLLHAGRPEGRESCSQWGDRMKKGLLAVIASSGWVREDQDSCAVKSCPKTLEVQVELSFRRSENTSAEAARVPVRTVHAVKGETHDTTYYHVIVPPNKKCISETWWSPEPTVAEERRVAFVAVTRSRDNFVLVVSPSIAANLKRLQSDFYATFKVMTVGEYLNSIKVPTPAMTNILK